MKRQPTDAEVRHLRQMLAWMRVEYSLDEDFQKGFIKAATDLLDAGLMSEQQAHQQLTERAQKIQQVPKYVRQAVKMLTKMVREFDGQKHIVDVETRNVQEIK